MDMSTHIILYAHVHALSVGLDKHICHTRRSNILVVTILNGYKNTDEKCLFTLGEVEELAGTK